jgi:hypothetical protein
MLNDMWLLSMVWPARRSACQAHNDCKWAPVAAANVHCVGFSAVHQYTPLGPTMPVTGGSPWAPEICGRRARPWKLPAREVHIGTGIQSEVHHMEMAY